jgi:hypothetical protein
LLTKTPFQTVTEEGSRVNSHTHIPHSQKGYLSEMISKTLEVSAFGNYTHFKCRPITEMRKGLRMKHALYRKKEMGLTV